MNISLGARLRDGRRAGIEWRRRRTTHGTVVHAVLRHEGDLSAEDLERCLMEIAEGERMLSQTSLHGSRRKVRA